MEGSLTSQIIGYIWCVFGIPPLIAAYLLEVPRFKNTFIIKARGRYSTQVLNIALWAVLMTSTIDYLILDYSEPVCSTEAGFTVTLSLQFGLSVYAMRTWVLLFRFRVAEQLSHPDSADTGSSWFLTHRRWISRPVKVAVVTSTLVVVLVVGLVLLFQANNDCEEKRLLVYYLSVIVVVVWALTMLTSSCFMRSTDREAFGIKPELRLDAIVGLIAVAATIVIQSTVSRETATLVVAIIRNLAISVVWCSSVYWPLYVAYNVTRNEPSKSVGIHGVGDIATLEDLLNTESGYLSFLAYTKHEFAQENVLFWKSFQDFKLKYEDPAKVLLNPDKCMSATRHIITQYIDVHAPMQVNLPASVFNQLFKDWSEWENRMIEWKGTKQATMTTNTTNSPPSPKRESRQSSTGGASSPILSAIQLTDSTATTSLTMQPLLTQEDNKASTPASSASGSTPLASSLDVVTIFDRAAHEIYQLMTTDLLPRYVKSEEFGVFVSQLKHDWQVAHPSSVHTHTDVMDSPTDGSAVIHDSTDQLFRPSDAQQAQPTIDLSLGTTGAKRMVTLEEIQVNEKI